VLVGAAIVAVAVSRNAAATPYSLSIAPAQPDEYLVLVGQWGAENDSFERRIVQTLRSSDAAVISSHVRLRVEPIEHVFADDAEAQSLANSVGAHLVVYGVEDAVGVEVVFQDIYAEPDSASRLHFIIPKNEQFNSIATEDMPVAMRNFLTSMLLHHFLRTSDIDGLAGFGFGIMDGEAVNLRVIPPSDLDRHILNMYQWQPGQDNVSSMTDTLTDALRVAPGDPTLVFLRGFLEAFYNGNIGRARVDADRLRQLLGETNLTLWMDMNISLAERDYARLLALSERLDPTKLGYSIPFSYRQMALVMTGDFARVQAETSGSIREQPIFGLPVYDALAAIAVQMQGDDTAFEGAAARVNANRDLSDATGFISSINNPPADFYFLGGYIAELTNTPLVSLLAYQGGLRVASAHYLINWRLGVFNSEAGNVPLAYQFLSAARDAAPVPFPIAAYQLAWLTHDDPDAVPVEAPSACIWLARATADTDADLTFYAPLIARIDAARAAWDCGG